MKKMLVVISLILVMVLAIPLAVSAEPGGGAGKPPYEPPPGPRFICIIGDGYDYPAPPVAPPNDDCQGEDED